MNTRITTVEVHVEKKLPIPGQQFSSQCYSASAEVEVAVDPEGDLDAQPEGSSEAADQKL